MLLQLKFFIACTLVYSVHAIQAMDKANTPSPSAHKEKSQQIESRMHGLNTIKLKRTLTHVGQHHGSILRHVHWLEQAKIFCKTDTYNNDDKHQKDAPGYKPDIQKLAELLRYYAPLKLQKPRALEYELGKHLTGDHKEDRLHIAAAVMAGIAINALWGPSPFELKTLLYRAVEHHDLTLAKFLLAAGANPNKHAKLSEPPMFVATKGSMEELLIRHGAKASGEAE